MDAKKLIFILFLLPLFGFSSYSPKFEILVDEYTLYLRAVVGDVDSQFKLASKYNSQSGLLREPGLAKKWFRAAALNGHAESQNNLAILYLEFNNYLEAKVWFESAAEQGHVEAHANLAEMYETGKGMFINLPKAHSLYHKAAIMGDVKAMYKVSFNLTSGAFLKKDMYTGCIWAYRAETSFVSNFDDDLKNNITGQVRNCQNNLSKSQILEVQGAAIHGLISSKDEFNKLMSLSY